MDKNTILLVALAVAAGAAIYFLYNDLAREKQKTEALARHLRRVEQMLWTFNVRPRRGSFQATEEATETEDEGEYRHIEEGEPLVTSAESSESGESSEEETESGSEEEQTQPSPSLSAQQPIRKPQHSHHQHQPHPHPHHQRQHFAPRPIGVMPPHPQHRRPFHPMMAPPPGMATIRTAMFAVRPTPPQPQHPPQPQSQAPEKFTHVQFGASGVSEPVPTEPRVEVIDEEEDEPVQAPKSSDDVPDVPSFDLSHSAPVVPPDDGELDGPADGDELPDDDEPDTPSASEGEGESESEGEVAQSPITVAATVDVGTAVHVNATTEETKEDDGALDELLQAHREPKPRSASSGSGRVYVDNAKNRRLGRVGQFY